MIHTPTEVITATQAWLENVVIGLNLCPFAKSVYIKKQIRYVVSEATTSEALLEELRAELTLLKNTDAGKIDTTLLIHPYVLTNFLDYNDFLHLAEATTSRPEFNEAFQIASLHPFYQFAGTKPNDIENYTNRSPYPMLHLLRESSVDKAVATFPEANLIFEKNIKTMKKLGHEGLKKLL